MHQFICWISWIAMYLVTRTFSVQHSGQPFQMQPENLNKRLLGYELYERSVSGHHQCASACMFLRACESINYILRNKSCELNSEGNDTVDRSDFVESTGAIYSDITDWPQSMVMGCTSHTCGQKQRCFPLGNDDYKCVDIYCDKPPDDTQYGIVQLGSNTAGSMRTYVFTCPEGTVVHGETNITCLLNGEWSSVSAYCKEKTLGTNCTSSGECIETGSECILGKCFCGRLYRYNDDIKDCVKVCSTMKDTFTAHTFTRIGGYNDRDYIAGEDLNLQACHQMCIGDIDCLSIEYGLNVNSGKMFCRASSLSQGMVEDALPETLATASFDLYSRDCV